MKIFLVILVLLGTGLRDYGYPNEVEQKMMVDAVNKIRSSGCRCGKRHLEPVQKVAWNDVLFESAYNQANEMKEFNFFAHFSKDGLNIGERLTKVGYDWMVAGENLGEGQITFEEVLHDWMKSYTHCTMLMNPKVNEMAVAKVDKYWVQHFGKQMPVKKP
ncbi:MAG: CAP domain-containing protein [Saprospiraceae bacterium]